ncbi:hypothetical protein [Absidia glauca]|uniref:Phosphatidylinositol N-acetylglucosaminyltransferase subunit H conserved domain-containing protein n=1 Tax=Absidia glauca TaxID=4829 RepID=A0A168SYW9_ABSGL|nr:hypothetical protein [Absidia glauca]
MSLCQKESTKKGYADSFTSKVLPGGHTHEYTVISQRRNIAPMDVLVLLIMAFAIWMNKTTYWLWLLPSAWLWIKLRNVKQGKRTTTGDRQGLDIIPFFFIRLESLLVMRDIGIQVKTTYWSGRTESKFINRLKIENVVINEGITLWQVKPYIAILVKDQDKMTIVFENLLPPLHPVLLETYRGTRQLLFPSSPAPSTPSSSSGSLSSSFVSTPS